MYDDNIFFDDNSCSPIKARRQSVIERFEAWLRTHGYEPTRDPFFPESTSYEETESAVDLVAEYLGDRPSELPNRRELLKHAMQLGDVTPMWGDNSCSWVPMFRTPTETKRVNRSTG